MIWLLLRAGEIGVPAGRVVRIGLVSWFINASLLGGLGFLSADAVRAADSRSQAIELDLADRSSGPQLEASR